MSNSHLVTAKDKTENDEGFELALALTKLLNAAQASLPQPKPGLELAKSDRQIFHKLIASKIFHGFQLEFITTSGEVIFGFVIGLDDYVVQIYDTGYGRDFTDNTRYDIEHYEVTAPVRHWLVLANIESIHENYFGVKHMDKDSQKALNVERRTIVKAAERWLYPTSRGE